MNISAYQFMYSIQRPYSMVPYKNRPKGWDVQYRSKSMVGGIRSNSETANRPNFKAPRPFSVDPMQATI